MASLVLLLSELIRPENEDKVTGKPQFSQMPVRQVAGKLPKGRKPAMGSPENRDAEDLEDLSELKVRVDEVWA
ncbi:hypothetical protein AMTR_s00101p00044960 [Amborella trichopoda]|uniref:Uncharacterized protein n=1 Tax=Amborella trichopoda TaxID=13333 RepID=W1NUS5_AMBTC|nr:hypothetical protein AMTR_s00101p00044960 [Amborella trichopoda]